MQDLECNLGSTSTNPFLHEPHPPLSSIVLNHSLSSSRTPAAPHIHPRWPPWLFSSSLWYMCPCCDSFPPLSPWCWWPLQPPQTCRNRWIKRASQPSLGILITLGLWLWIPVQLWCWPVRLPAFHESQHSKYPAHPKGGCVLPWCLTQLFCPNFTWAGI